MAPARNVIVAGAGIGGLTAALAIARSGLRVTVMEQAERLEETGAGIQLSPNATRVLLALGLGDRLKNTVLAPDAIRVMSGGSAREIVRIPLGKSAEERYGAPYWMIHRADLQAALADAARTTIDVTLNFGTRIEDFTAHRQGVTVQYRREGQVADDSAIALIGADGLWSSVRGRMRRDKPPRYLYRTAWRALIPTESAPEEFRQPVIHLWLGREAHLVHYPVRGGALINIVAIAEDNWQTRGWSAPGDPQEVMRHFSRWDWADKPRALLALPDQWLKWALFDRRKTFRGVRGPVTLLGDAAHPMVPFLAQGAAMAIEDAAILAGNLAKKRDEPARAMRAYEKSRRKRVRRVMRAARKQGRIYGRFGPEGLVRNIVMRSMGGEKILGRLDWLYTWRPPEFWPEK